MIDRNDIENRFTYQPPDEERAIQHTLVRHAGRSMAELVNENVPDSREKTLAIHKIEEAVMWANAALARQTPE